VDSQLSFEGPLLDMLPAELSVPPVRRRPLLSGLALPVGAGLLVAAGMIVLSVWLGLRATANAAAMPIAVPIVTPQPAPMVYSSPAKAP
jgi:hypothetical protein